MEQERKKHLEKLHSHLDFYNKMAPFPVYDTEYVAKVKDEIDNMEEDFDYDSLPLEACRFCKSLHIVMDDDENNICFRCGSINELQAFDNIYEYNKYIEDYGKTE